MQSDGANLGLRVRRAREVFGWTQYDLAVRADVDTKTISRLENGHIASPRHKTVFAITSALGIPLGEYEYFRNETDAVLPPLPSQDPLVRIEANADDKLELQTSFSDEDDVATIEVYKSQFLEILTKEIIRYGQNKNRPQATLFLPRHRAIVNELSKPVEKINFAAVYLAFSRLNIAREQAEREVAKKDSDWPDFYPEEKEAINSLCMLSGPLVMASSAGRKLITDTAMYNLKESDEDEADRFLSLYIKDIREQGVASSETESFLEEIEIPAQSDPNPQRTRRVKFALVGSLMIVTAGAAVISVATLPTAAAIGTSSLIFLPYIWSKKVIENDPDFKKLVKDGGEKLQNSSLEMSERSEELIRKLSDVFERNSDRIERIGEIVSEFRWTKTFVRLIDDQKSSSREKSLELCIFLAHEKSLLAKKLSGLFDRMVDHTRVHVFEFPPLDNLDLAVKVSRSGGNLVLVWDEESGVEDVMRRLTSINRRMSFSDRNLIALVTQKPGANSSLWQYAARNPMPIGSFAPNLMMSLKLEELSLYELTLPL